MIYREQVGKDLNNERHSSKAPDLILGAGLSILATTSCFICIFPRKCRDISLKEAKKAFTSLHISILTISFNAELP
jgi:hypothetical protein